MASLRFRIVAGIHQGLPASHRLLDKRCAWSKNRFAAQTVYGAEAMEQDDLDRIRFITRHFHELKGLKEKVPFGLLLLGTGIGQSLSLKPGLLLLGAVLWLERRADLYYSCRFGRVERQPKRSTLGIVTRVLALLILVFLLLPIGARVFGDGGVLCLFVGSLLSVGWFRSGCQPSRAHDIALGALLLDLAVHGIHFGISTPATPSIVNYLACGTSLILAGLLDHRLLVRSLKPIEESDLAVAEEER